MIGESNNNFTSKPNDDTTKTIKNLFGSGVTKMKQQKLNEALKDISLTIDMSRRSWNSCEVFVSTSTGITIHNIR